MKNENEITYKESGGANQMNWNRTEDDTPFYGDDCLLLIDGGNENQFFATGFFDVAAPSKQEVWILGDHSTLEKMGVTAWIAIPPFSPKSR